MKSEKIKINNVDYVVTELTVRHILPLMEKGDSVNLSIEIAKQCITVAGQPIGDKLLDVSFSTYQKLMEKVNSVHGFGGEIKNA